MRKKILVGRPFDLQVLVSDDAGPALTKGNKARRKVALGRRWELKMRERGGGIDLINAVTRASMALTVLVVGALSLVFSAYIGFEQRSYGPVVAVWAVVGPISTWVMSYYFASRRRSE